MLRNKKVLFLLGATTVVSFQYALYPLNAVTDYKKSLAPMFLTPPTRSEQIASLKSSKLDPFDVLIIGGGATGAGCALDASLRGLKVALVEANDFSSGTSSKSTKLIHGGLRYLEKAVFSLDVQQLKMVYEGLSERRILLRQAPHLCSSLPTLLPCYAWWEIALYYLGLKAYDMVALSGRGSIRGSSYLSSQETLRQFPPLLPSTAKNESLKGAIMYFDGHMDDARLNVSIILTAACNGAVTVNYNRVEKILLNDNGKACAVNIRDTLDGSEYTVYAKSIINAAGPFSDSVRMLECKTVKPRMVHSAGTHVTLPKFYAPKESGLIIPKTDDGRVFFLLPWKNYAIAGTTDNVVPLSESPQARDEDLDFIFSQMKKYLGFEVSKKDVKSAWCGIRPLVANSTAEESQNLVRDHTVTVSNGGVLSIVGGKWTTYRLMAKDAIDTLLTEVIPEAQKRALPCCTHQLVLHGSEYYSSALPAQLAKEKGIDYDVAEHLSETYGSQSWDVLSARQEEPAFLQKRIAPDLPILEAEVYYSALHEYTETIRDFLARRVRICFLDTEKALSCSRKVAEIMGEVKGWSVSKIEQEMKEFEDFLSKEFTVQT